MLVGGSHIDHADRLRSASTSRVLGFRVMAPSTLGTFLRSFTWGHVRQLDKAVAETLGRVWALGVGPGNQAVTIDVDSTICEVSGKTKSGAAYGHTKVLGYHPLIATQAETGEIIGVRLRGGSSQRGNTHFVVEAINRIRRAGATGDITLRADSGFFSYDLLAALDRLGADWSITIPLHSNVRAAIETIDEDDWTTIDYPEGGNAQVAETIITSAARHGKRQTRIVVRRSRLTDPHQLRLWPGWRYHTLVTNTGLSPVEADQHHRRHATCELAIRDLKHSAGLAHLPSANFFANAAWLACAALTHNLYRWITRLGQTQPAGQLTAGRSIRTRLFGIPARVVNHSGRHLLRLPTRWPWATTYHTALQNLRSLPQLC